MSVDREVERHLETWHGFSRLMFWAALHVVVILALLAFFLL